LDVTDAVMIARGDLGVELPPEQVPWAQRQLINMARVAGIPIIVATQMLESMISNARPTRAEVTDVSLAVESGADAVMLSAETAVGEHVLEAIRMMDRIARQTEAQLWSSGEYGRLPIQLKPPIPLWSVIAQSTSRMSRDLMARAVMVVTRSGKSAEIAATARPASPVVAMTHDPAVCRKLCLHWGVVPVLDDAVGTENPNELVRLRAIEMGLAIEGQYVLLVRGFHGEGQRNLPSVTVVEV
ncbi:MAG: pyruvate kinase, partial [Proteobacteria bacterium]|nr:pyruvate kinase [Pseudomonadota bacterium]